MIQKSTFALNMNSDPVEESDSKSEESLNKKPSSQIDINFEVASNSTIFRKRII